MAAYREALTIDEFVIFGAVEWASEINLMIYELELMVWIQPEKMAVINN